MKNKKGFTLIELLAVVVILAAIALIVTPIVIGSIKESKERLYDTQIESIKSSAKSYMIDLDLEDNATITLTLSDLKKAGYVKKDIKNPKTGKYFNDCLLVSVKRIENIYEYDVIDNTDEQCDISEELVMILLGSTEEVTTKNKEYIEPGVIVKTINGQELDSSKVKVEINQYKDNSYQQKITGSYSDIKSLIDTSDYYEYEIKYIYEDSIGSVSKTRKVIVRDANNLQCIILTNGIKNNYGWVTDNRIAKIISINSNKKVEYSISTTGEKNYSNNQTIEIENDGNVKVYGYIKDDEGNESACTSNIKFEIGEPSCNINLTGTQLSSGWYTSNVVATLETKLISPLISQGMNQIDNVEYNEKTNLEISESGEIYGYIRDMALKSARCNQSINIDKTTSVGVTIDGVIENTTNVYTSGTLTNKNVTLNSTVNPVTTVSGYSYQWYKDDNKISSATTPSYTAEESGIYKLVVTTGSGIIGTSNEIDVEIDKIAPVVNYSLSGGLYSEQQTILVTSSDENYAYMDIVVTKNSVRVYEESNITSETKNITLTGDGRWYIFTKAYDKAGNKQSQEPENTSGWYYQAYNIDSTLATANLTAKDVSGKIKESGVVSNSWLNVSITGTTGYALYYCIDSDNTCTPTTKYTGTFRYSTEGIHYIRYKASKQVGNTLKESEVYSYQANIKLIIPKCSISITGTKGSNDWYTGNLKATMTKVGNGSYGMRNLTLKQSWIRNITEFTNVSALKEAQTIQGFVYAYPNNTERGANCTSEAFKYDNTPPINVTLTVSKKTEKDKYICGGNQSGYIFCDYDKIVGYTLTANASDPESEIWAYHFYVNGKLVSSSSSNTYIDTENNNKSAKYEVRVYNRAGLYTSSTVSESCKATNDKCNRNVSDGVIADSSETGSYYIYTCDTEKTWCQNDDLSGGCSSTCGPSEYTYPGVCVNKNNGSVRKDNCV